MSIVQHIKVLDSQLANIKIVAGSTIYTRDTGKHFIDINDTERVQISDIIYIDTDKERTALLAPLPDKLYITRDTNKVWVYSVKSDKWVCLNIDTTYTAGTGISIDGTTINNSGVRAVTAGASANKININTNGNTNTITIDNVANAVSASKAASDSAGQQINTTYIKGLSVSGKVITYTKGDGTTGTITTQDTNTWRGIQNVLTSDSTTDSLSAAQGKALKGLVDGKADKATTLAGYGITDSYTKTEVDNKVNVRSSKTLPDNAPDGTIIIDPDECSKGFNVSIDVDTTLSATSTNPVQNKAVKTALDNKHDKNANVLVGIADYRSLGFNDKYCLQFDANTIGQNPVGMKVIINGNDTGRLVGENAFTNDNYAFKGASDYDDGEAGLVPAPTVDEYDYFLKGDGSWAEIPQPTVTVDAELSSTSTNPVQNKVIKEALDGKLGKNETAARATQDGAGNTISTTYASKADVATLLSTKLGVTATAYAATRDGAGNNIVDTYAKKTDISGMVKTVNGTAPDSAGNVAITVSGGGGGVSTSESNTWTGKQTFQKMKFNFESYNAPRISGTIDNPSSSVAVYNVQGNFTLDMSVLAGLLSNSDATLFTAYITANGAYTLSITNAGTLKYVGNASDLAITVNGLLLNILLIKSSSGDLSSVVQASALS